MIKLVLDGIITLLTTIIRIIVFPINQLMINLLPDLSSKITEVTDSIAGLFNGLFWSLGLIPLSIKTTIIFIISVEVARHTIFVSTHAINLVLAIIKKIKFW